MKLRDPESLPRILIAGSLVLAPLAYLCSSLVAPPLRASDRGQLVAVAAHPERAYFFALFTIAGSILLIPAIIGITQLLRDSNPWLGYTGGGLAALGALIAIGDSFGLLTYWQMAARGVDRAPMIALMHRLDDAQGISLVFNVGGIAVIAGTVLLGIGLLRSRVVPRWAAVALPVGTVVNIVGFANHSLLILDLSALLLLAAFAPIAARTLELPKRRHATPRGIQATHQHA